VGGEVVVTEQTGDGRRVQGVGLVLVLLAVPAAALFISGARDVWFSAYGPEVPVQVVECHCKSSKNCRCTGVWQPTGEPEKTVTIHGEVPTHGTVDVRIHGNEAWTHDAMWKKSGFFTMGLGLVCLVALIVTAIVRRKSKS
jgi:hypothetical protein